MRIRPSAVAGTFYPGDAQDLRAIVDGHLAHGRVVEGLPAPKAIIAPHAGFVYSGPVAGSAYAALAPRCQTISRVLLVGPAHRVPFKGLATSSAMAFATPLGAVPLDRPLLADWMASGWIREFDAAHAGEHSLEVQLPFLQRLVPHALIAPVLTGDGDSRAVEALLDHAFGGEETLIVVSSDLSHYLPYAIAKRQDEATARRLERMELNAAGFDDACGATAINGLLAVATRRGLACQRIDLRNSGDTAGGRDQVVGYGAFALG
jgi:AmmeMemoRadiSam system protein B